MSGDNLTIGLFLIGTGIAIGLTAMNAAGWRHPVLIQSLFAISCLFILGGFFWSSLKTLSPAVSHVVVQIGTNPVAWFVIFMVGVASAHLRPRTATDGRKP